MMRCVCAALALLIGGQSWAQENRRPDIAIPIEDFELMDAEGVPFHPRDLRGKAWIAHFFFTTCKECTQTAPTMMALQKLVAGKKDYRLVSISLNQDAAADLKSYRNDLGGDPKQWIFLTGPKEKVHAIVQTIFKQHAADSDNPSPGAEVQHSFNVAVIDPQGVMVGFENGKAPDSAAKLYALARSTVHPKYLLPAMNASLNGLAAILLILGYRAIKARQETLHKWSMTLALLVSAVFLASYLYFHFVVQDGQPARFSGQGFVRYLYFGILLTHTILAVIVAPLAIAVAVQGWRGRLASHVRLARWTWPMWLYVSITGIVVYWMLYQMYPPY
jgi:protein SCO1/2